MTGVGNWCAHSEEKNKIISGMTYSAVQARILNHDETLINKGKDVPAMIGSKDICLDSIKNGKCKVRLEWGTNENNFENFYFIKIGNQQYYATINKFFKEKIKI